MSPFSRAKSTRHALTHQQTQANCPPVFHLVTFHISLRSALGDERFAASKYDLARKLLSGTIQGKEYADFLTTLCYDHILSIPASAL